MQNRQRCRGKTKEGRPCGAPAIAGRDYCYFHAHPEQARIQGQKGGRGNRYAATDLTVPENGTSQALAAVLDRALEELLAGRLQPRIATALAQLVNTRRRLTERVELERRIAQLERQMESEQSHGAGLPGAEATRDRGVANVGETP